MMPSRGTSTGKRLRRVKTRFGTSVASPCSGSSLDWTSSETRTIIGESLANHWCQLMMLMSAGVGCKVSRSLKDMSVLFCYILLYSVIQHYSTVSWESWDRFLSCCVSCRFPRGIPSGDSLGPCRFEVKAWPGEPFWRFALTRWRCLAHLAAEL